MSPVLLLENNKIKYWKVISKNQDPFWDGHEMIWHNIFDHIKNDAVSELYDLWYNSWQEDAFSKFIFISNHILNFSIFVVTYHQLINPFYFPPRRRLKPKNIFRDEETRQIQRWWRRGMIWLHKTCVLVTWTRVITSSHALGSRALGLFALRRWALCSCGLRWCNLAIWFTVVWLRLIWPGLMRPWIMWPGLAWTIILPGYV